MSLLTCVSCVLCMCRILKQSWIRRKMFWPPWRHTWLRRATGTARWVGHSTGVMWCCLNTQSKWDCCQTAGEESKDRLTPGMYVLCLCLYKNNCFSIIYSNTNLKTCSASIQSYLEVESWQLDLPRLNFQITTPGRWRISTVHIKLQNKVLTWISINNPSNKHQSACTVWIKGLFLKSNLQAMLKCRLQIVAVLCFLKDCCLQPCKVLAFSCICSMQLVA